MNQNSDLRVLCQQALQGATAERLAKVVIVLSEALSELGSRSSIHLSKMNNYFDNQCCPSIEEVNYVDRMDSLIRVSLQKANAIARN